MGKVKEQQLWRSEHATDWEEDLPTWYQYHERELDSVVSDVIIHRANEMVNAVYELTLNCSTDLIGHEEVIETMCTYASPYEDDGGDPELIEALEFWIVQPWFGDELKKHGEIVNEDFLGFCIWGRTCSGQAISLDYVVQDILKDIVERRKANG
jgi:hypothetical protein